MKRWLDWFLLAVAAVFLWISHRLVRVPPGAAAAVRTQNEFVSNVWRALRGAGLVLGRSRAGPRNLFAPAFAWASWNITDEGGPPWLDYRGPPGPNACSNLLVAACKSAGQAGAGSQKGEDFPRNSELPECNFKNEGFATAFS